MNATPYLAVALAVAFGLLGTAKLTAAPAMRARAAHVGFTVDAYRGIGALEILAVVGIVAGVILPVLGTLAAAGLLVLLAGAVVTHLRKGDGVREIAPALVLGLVTLAFLLLSIGNVG